jgi:hypothetical protein
MDFAHYEDVKELIHEKAMLERLIDMWHGENIQFDNVTVKSEGHAPFTMPLKDLEAMGVSLDVPFEMKTAMRSGLNTRLQWIHGELGKKGVTGL